MKHFGSALAVAFLLALSGSANPHFLNSQRNAVVTLTNRGHVSCTGYARDKHMVLTASHCLTPSTRVDGETVEELARDGHDHSLLCTKATLKPNAPGTIPSLARSGDTVFYWGHPAGLPLMFREGHVAGRGEDPDGLPVTLFDMNSYNGDSGAPIFNSAGKVVGTVSIRMVIEDFSLVGAYPYAFTSKQWKLKCP